MTEEATAAQAANPYNAKQSNASVDVQRGILSADDTLAAPRQPEVTQDAIVPDVEAVVPDVPVEDTPDKYKSVDYKKRYDDLKKHYDSKLNEFKVKESALSQKIKDGLPTYVPPKTQEELATFKENDPEAFATIEAIADLRSQERASEIDERLVAIETREAQVAKTEAFSKLSQLQPDFEEIKATEGFHEWVDNQPQDIQDWLYRSFNPKLASRAIDLFKQDTGWKKKEEKVEKKKPGPKPKAKPSAADMVDVSTKSEPSPEQKKVWTTKEINDIVRHTPLEAEKLMDEWESAQREGRLIKG